MSLPPMTRLNGQKAAFWLVLTVSIVLNLSFVGGYLHANVRADQLQEDISTIAAVADRVGLDAEQRALLRGLQKEASAQVAFLVRANTPVMESFWAELARPQLDKAALKWTVVQVGQRNVEFTLRMADLLRQFLGTLSPKQQREFIEVVQPRRVAGL